MEGTMPEIQLPDGASHEHLKNQAKTLLKSLRSGDANDTARVIPYFSDPTKVGINQAQLVIAREYGFGSWRRILLEVSKTRAASGALDSTASDDVVPIALDGSPLQFE
jgi:hypothetical protein